MDAIKYTKPEVEIVKFSAQDIITTTEEVVKPGIPLPGDDI